jgi:hypothetical protein
MRHGCSFGLSLPLSADIVQLIKYAKLAECSGFDYVFMPDHVTSLDGKQPLNVWDVLSVLAMHTRSIKLGSLVANVYRQHPLTLKQHVDTLNSISGGRAFVGLGAGTRFDCDELGIKRSKPLETVFEAIKTVEPNKIVVGARGLRMKAIASGTDGWVSRHALSPSEFHDELLYVKDMVASNDFLYIADVPVSFIDEPWLWKTLSYRYLLQTKYWDKPFTKRMKFDIEADSTSVKRSILDGFSAVGDCCDVTIKLKKYIDAGANVLSIRLYGDDASFPVMREVIGNLKYNP